MGEFITRCYNKNAKTCYKYHGALGIRVSAEWLNNFEAFYAYIGVSIHAPMRERRVAFALTSPDWFWGIVWREA